MKIGLATQGLGGIVPKLDGLLPGNHQEYVDSLAGHIEDAVSDEFDNIEEILGGIESSAANKDAILTVEPFIRKAEGVGMDDKDWESELSGLTKITSRLDKSVAWVSDEGLVNFKKNGRGALFTTNSKKK